ncbi:MAG: FKBP-type peptidyl-prolyl cis-trans isomerase [Bacteroidota bacterium]
MIRLLLFFFALVIVFLGSCRQKQSKEYSRSEKGYYYQLLAIGDGHEKPDTLGALLCDIMLRTSSDSVFFNSFTNLPDGFYISLLSKNPRSGKSYLSTLVEGDSVSLMIDKDPFFREYFDTIVPFFYTQDSLVKMDLKVRKLVSKNSYEVLESHMHSVLPEDKELSELKQIDDYLKDHYPDVTVDGYGLYHLEHTKTSGESVSSGKKIRISFSGFYLSGKPIDNGSQQLEFTFGTPDQLIKGLNIVIGNLKKGETTKIIVPSRLAFGELGSSNGSIPPYTPLVYNVKLIDIK